MSIALMSLAFKTAIPATRKLVFIALCDSANDQGECYPSISALTLKCSSGERTIQDAITWLEREGFLRREFRAGRSTVYWVTDPRSWRTPAAAAPPQLPHPTPAVAAPPPPQQPHPTPAVAAPITINEPSVEPSRNQIQSKLALAGARPSSEAPPKAGKANAQTPTRPDGVDSQVWADWLQLRKAKRAPVTKTVLDGAISEAAKAGLSLDEFLRVWCRRGTQGLEAAWLTTPRTDGKTAAAFDPQKAAQERANDAAARAYASGQEKARQEAARPIAGPPVAVLEAVKRRIHENKLAIS